MERIQMNDIGINFTQLGDIDEDPTYYIDFSDKNEYDMSHEMEEHIHNDLINSMSNDIPLTLTKNIDISIEVGMKFSERKDRNKNINAFFDDFVTFGTTLKEFVEKYNQAVDARYESLKKENFESMPKEKHLQFNMLLEEHATRVYTRAIYVKFVNELSHILSFFKEKLKIDGEWVTYRVFNKRDIKDLAIIEIKLESREARYSCLYFEFIRILCRHVLAFFVENVEQIPEYFILRHWRKERNDMLSTGREMCFLNRDGLVHNLHLSSKCYRLIELAQRSDETFKFISDGLDSLATSAEKFPTYGESNPLGDTDV
ncbi:protein FAR1-RELATED SEQUENCE 5-like [Gastrolobium bilobum]|uniref:protein FAR1-RELATED SEQUENCE 5-like n=1 Tax=Gastrolobium bilobum TaxID=150636 RepID=UPI002AB0E15D|nr:protein FAR1-RELATED SEQUENCE 5-like [Gastrolobium bilobum]